MVVAALILGIASLALSFWGKFAIIGVGCGIAGIILSILGKKKQPEKAGMAKAALVLSIIGTALSAVLFITCVACTACVNKAGNEFADQLASELSKSLAAQN